MPSGAAALTGAGQLPVAAVPLPDARARYNLADTLDELRRFDEAAEHWRAYVRFNAGSEWAEHAKDRVTATC